MSNYILEEKIKTLSTQYIEQQSVSNFLLLLMSILEREYDEPSHIHYEIHNDISELQYAIKNYVLQLEDLLDEDNKDARSAALEDCIDLRKKLLSIYETIYQYTSSWNLYFTLFSDEVAIRKYKEQDISHQKINWDIFYSDCQQFLEDSDTVLEQKTRIGQLLKCIPFQMARSKYYDMLKLSLQHFFEEESEQMITCFLKIFQNIIMPENNENYGKYFTELSQWFSSHNNIIPRELSDEALQEEYTDFQSVFENLDEIEDIFNCIFNDINSLIALFFSNYSFSELTQNDVAHADLYHTICEMLNGELSETEKEAYLEQVRTSLENATETSIDSANDIAQKELKYLKKINDFSKLSEDTKKILLMEDFLRSSYYADIEEELFHFDIPEDAPPASPQWKQKTFDEFIDTMAKALSKLPAQIRKSSMQLLSGAFPPVFTVEEAISMVKTAIDSANTFEQKILIVDKIGMMFEQNDFLCEEDTDEDDFDFSQFLFDEHCDCGHDHHHHNHCDCGHDHHDHHH